MKHLRIVLSMLLLIATAIDLAGQTWGIGLRMGDPTGITLKKYLKGKALELNIGRSGRYGYDSDWYGQEFYRWSEARGFKRDDISYEGYHRATPVAIQVHYLIQKRLDKASKSGGRLDWYYGFGGQMRFNTYYYRYRYKPREGGPWITVPQERVPNTNIGADAVIGLEYLFKGPFSLFLDGNLYLELVDDPFRLWTQAGLGIRFRF